MGSQIASHIGGIQAMESHWLVRRSAAEVFYRGIIRLDSVKGSKFHVLPHDSNLLGA
jgi:hypothetical protein